MIENRTSHSRGGFRAAIKNRPHFWSNHPLIAVLTFATAAVWLLFGLWFKVLGMVPRHRLIVAVIAGDGAAASLTVFIGVAEILLALWILSGLYPRFCAALQTLAIAIMNTLELTLARSLLVAPILMICANAVFLIVVWYCALKSSETRS